MAKKAETKVETGRVFYRDDEDVLWEAVSYQDEDGVVTTHAALIPEDDDGEVH